MSQDLMRGNPGLLYYRRVCKPLYFEFKIFAFILFVSVMTACNTDNQNESHNNFTEKESVPDSVVQFLITSAATDFHTHQPPKPIDFRNVEIGYLLSADSAKQYVLCGEYLAAEKAEKKEWETFATVKTSGYEQYLGGNKQVSYCQDAIKVLTDGKALSEKLKSKYESLQ
ncbi:MAG: hypothetical protein R3C61_17410 [Bacteroidia bacterium]